MDQIEPERVGSGSEGAGGIDAARAEPSARGVSDEVMPTLGGPAAARLRAMFDEHYDAVWRMLRRLGLDPASADDGAQQVYIVAARRLEDIEPGKERSFLFGTASRIASSLRQRRGRSREQRLDTDPPPASGGRSVSAEELIEQKRRRELLDAILDEMDDDLRIALVLAEIEGLGKKEIAVQLGVPEGTAASRVRRAREDFTARLGRVMAARRIR